MQLKYEQRTSVLVVFQRKHTDDQQTYKKILYIPNHQGNAKQNHNGLSPHNCQSDCQQIDKK